MGDSECDALDVLVCPVDGEQLRLGGGWLHCPLGHAYPVVEQVPVLLPPNVAGTIGLAEITYRLAREWAQGRRDDRLFIETLGISEVEKARVRVALNTPSDIDPVVSYLVASTNGILYKELVGKCTTAPLPDIRLPKNMGRLLDIGCSWGRWSMAAAKKGNYPIGLDPSLGAVLAAKRLAGKLGLRFAGVVGDARYLPLRESAVDAAFSYSVLQHFSKSDVMLALREIARVTRPGGLIKIQMASVMGIKSLQHMIRRRLREPEGFEVCYWRPLELMRAFHDIFDNVELEADCYFGLGLQSADSKMFSAPRRALIGASEVLRKASIRLSPLALMADSLYLTSQNRTKLAPGQ